ncbi:MAG: hypothetical protein Q7P63_03895 [Verrucomicrobiota bacterium JB022]|nr:hypothetical protein [Verrucomicrobiota bacterium JB022]
MRHYLTVFMYLVAWLASVGCAFFLGFLASLGMHQAPTGVSIDDPDFSWEEREVGLWLQESTGEAPDFAALKSIARDDLMPEQVETLLRDLMLADEVTRTYRAQRLAEVLAAPKERKIALWLQQQPQTAARDDLLKVFRANAL